MVITISFEMVSKCKQLFLTIARAMMQLLFEGSCYYYLREVVIIIQGSFYSRVLAIWGALSTQNKWHNIQ